MKYKPRSSIGDKVGIGVLLGLGAGVVGATVGTIWGGYEIGSAINNALEIESTVGRGALDLLVMGIIAGPVYAVGIYGGMAAGAAIGAIAHPIIEGTKKIFKRQ